MNNKTFWIGWVVIFIVMQVIGYAIHVVVMAVGLSLTVLPSVIPH